MSFFLNLHNGSLEYVSLKELRFSYLAIGFPTNWDFFSFKVSTSPKITSFRKILLRGWVHVLMLRSSSFGVELLEWFKNCIVTKLEKNLCMEK